MKLSLSWIFEHISGGWRRYDIEDLVEKFNKTTAEIDKFYPLKLDLECLTLVEVETINFKDITAFSPEWKKEFEVPARQDIKVGGWFLVKKNGKEIEWATLSDLGAESKEGLVPAVTCPLSQRNGSWKKNIAVDDYILELDNTSVTHRADLWGVRGVAREFAAILDLDLKPLDLGLKKIVPKKVEKEYFCKKNEFSIVNAAPKACRRFAGLYFSEIEHKPSSLWMASLLARTDNRPIDLLVDITNYIMLDLSQPMHVFDAEKIEGNLIKPRMAKKGEELQLLDESIVKLTSDDLVIADDKKAVALAGIMGGLTSGVSRKTKSIFLEVANFDSSVIRKTSSRLRLRTEASVRFEKGLNPNQNITALARFLKILDDEKVAYKTSGPIISVGKEFKPFILKISHELIEKNLGVEIPQKFVVDTLKKIDFTVKPFKPANYEIVVPPFRGTKNVTIAVDIVEEVGRFWGWDNIPLSMPTREMKPNDIHAPMNVRKIKQQCAFGLHMHEVQNYPFYDESFLRELKWEPTDAVRAKNPLSQNVTRLVTSLVPHLLKNVHINITKADQLRFFELNRVWHMRSKIAADEKKSLAAVLWDYCGKRNFYDGKELLSSLFVMLHMPIIWEKAQGVRAPWYNQHQTAVLKHNKKVIGYAGMIDERFAENVGQGSAFIFELDAEMLIDYQVPEICFEPLNKYPYVYHDVSMLVPFEHTVGHLSELIKKANDRIYDVELLDMFSKDEWGDRRSLTFRFYMRHPEKTLTGVEVELVNRAVLSRLQELGAEIR